PSSTMATACSVVGRLPRATCDAARRRCRPPAAANVRPHRPGVPDLPGQRPRRKAGLARPTLLLAGGAGRLLLPDRDAVGPWLPLRRRDLHVRGRRDRAGGLRGGARPDLRSAG